MQHARLVFPDLDSRRNQLVEVGARGRAHNGRIAAPRHQQAHIHAAQRRAGERHHGGLAGHEVRRGEPGPLARRMDRLHVHAVDGFQHVVGAAGHDLHGNVAGLDLRQHGAHQVVDVAQVFAGGIGPVLQEGGLQPAHRAALDTQVDVMVGVGPGALVFLVGDVDAAGETHAAVAHHDLAVGAVVGHRAQAAADARVVEERNLHARGMQRRHELAADALGAQRVEQQAHRHALPCALHQQVAQRGADPVRLEDVVLEVNVVARRAHRVEDGVEGARAAREQRHARRAGNRQPAGRGAQPRHLLQRRRRVLRRIAQARQVGLGVRAGPAAQALDALLPQALRPEEVIDDEARERQQRERQDPAHGGHRCTLLHHDPDRQHGDIAAPGQREAGFPFLTELGEDQSKTAYE